MGATTDAAAALRSVLVVGEVAAAVLAALRRRTAAAHADRARAASTPATARPSVLTMAISLPMRPPTAVRDYPTSDALAVLRRRSSARSRRDPGRPQRRMGGALPLDGIVGSEQPFDDRRRSAVPRTSRVRGVVSHGQPGVLSRRWTFRSSPAAPSPTSDSARQRSPSASSARHSSGAYLGGPRPDRHAAGRRRVTLGREPAARCGRSSASPSGQAAARAS